MAVRFIHVVCISSLFFFIEVQNSVIIFQNAFSDSTVDGHLGLSHFGPVPNRAAMNFLLVDIRILGHVPRGGSWITHMSIFCRYHHTFPQSDCTNIYTLSRSVRVFQVPLILANTKYCHILILAILVAM